MEKVLSQEEVDALLGGLAGGGLDSEAEVSSSDGCKTFDFTAQERIVRGRMPTMEIIHDRFARLFQSFLMDLMRQPVEFVVTAIEAKRFSAFVGTIPLPSAISIIKFEPLRGVGLFVLDAPLVYMIIDHFYGGSGQTHVKPEGREFTPIQQRMVRKVMDAALKDLTKAWEPVYPLDLELVRIENNPQFAMVMTPTEFVVVVTMRLDLADVGRDLFLCLPYSMVEPIRDRLAASFQTDNLGADNTWGARVRQEVLGCPVSLEVELGKGTIKIDELQNLEIGDVILLEQPVTDPLCMTVADRLKFRCVAGTCNGNQAVRITEKVTKLED